VKRGMDTDEVLARFRRERQVLAGLDHPGIARLLDGGAAEDGRPFLAMEYVVGEPITDYCDRNRLDVAARLALFEQACAAVQHAHRRLVVHRDLKPSNVLVTAGGGGALQVKLLDFGIAKLLQAREDEALTRTEARRLTPAYAAPEQVRGEAVTTAADVYALGVILHELLTGTRPPDPPRLPGGLVTAEAAVARRTTAERLRRRLRGDLDTIVLAALREEPEARYPSVESLLDDLRRHREGLPVQARPASAGYRLRKFARRHRAGVTAAALVLLALLLGLGATAWQARETAREAARAERARDFALSLLEIADPDVARGEDVTAHALLDAAAERAARELADEPEVEEAVLDALAEINYRQGRAEEAERLFARVLALREARLGPADTLLAESLNNLAVLRAQHGHAEEAEALHARALAIRLGRLGPDHPDVAVSHYNLGVLARAQNDLESAERHHREALRIRRAHFGPEAEEVAQSVRSLALVQHQRGAYADAEALYREALALHARTDGAEGREASMAMNSLGALLETMGAYAEADTLLRRTVALQRRLYEGDNPQLVRSLTNYGILLVETGEAERAQGPLEEALAMARRLFEGDHAGVAVTQSSYALASYEQGRLAEAAAELEQALAMFGRLGRDGFLTEFTLRWLAEVHLARGDLAAADTLYRRARAVQEAELPARHPGRADVLLGLGRVALARGRPAEAEPLLRRALALRREGLGEGHPRTAEAESWLGACLAAQGRRAEAAPLLSSSARVLGRPARRSISEAVRANLAAYGPR
ncbi:MAG TPA: serine/threonine-protein kinase, partial [Rubricoccaceae bacterium]|nr:serine/threonine-protein kinase [Rubricoccaceae bacterium]